MKGVILAGGKGERLRPLTNTLNKHLLPIAGRAMVTYPLDTLCNLGIRDTMIVSSAEWVEALAEAARRHKPSGACAITTAVQKRPDGIVGALLMAADFVGEDICAVILGDNIFSCAPVEALDCFRSAPQGGMVFLSQVNDPTEFGIAEVAGGKICALVEKPLSSSSRLAVTGLYFYDNSLFSRARALKPSQRGELEITSLNTAYLATDELSHRTIDGWWLDCGSHTALERAELLLQSERNETHHE